MENSADLLAYIQNRLLQSGTRHEVHHFPSGAIMIDLWIDDRFYVVQLDQDAVGLSLVTADTPFFDVIPDQAFQDDADFKAALEALLSL